MSRRGYIEWVAQRITALIVGVYTLFISAYFFLNRPMDFATWHALFNHISIKALTFIVLLSIAWHTWIGLWTVMTDYIKNISVRVFLEILVLSLLVFYMLWGFEVLWTMH